MLCPNVPVNKYVKPTSIPLINWLCTWARVLSLRHAKPPSFYKPVSPPSTTNQLSSLASVIDSPVRILSPCQNLWFHPADHSFALDACLNNVPCIVTVSSRLRLTPARYVLTNSQNIPPHLVILRRSVPCDQLTLGDATRMR